MIGDRGEGVVSPQRQVLNGVPTIYHQLHLWKDIEEEECRVEGAGEWEDKFKGRRSRKGKRSKEVLIH